MTIDYDQLKSFVKEAMFTGGGIMEPSAPEDVPHRMPAAEPSGKEQDMGDPKANKLYDLALIAREATEQLVESLDEPIFDGAYEHAFKASACLRRVLNSLEESGAHPMPDQRVVAPPPWLQKYGTSGGNPYSGGVQGTGAAFSGGAGLEEAEEELTGFGSGVVSQQAHGISRKEKGMDIATGGILQGVDDRERKILIQLEDILTDIADKVDLVKYRPYLKTFAAALLKKVKSDPDFKGAGEKT